MTLAQVSAATRIPPAVLEDLERGCTASSGAAVYARGHLRAIARVTGADPQPLLEAHAREAGAPVPTPVPETAHPAGQRTGSLELPRSARPERRGPRWGFALVGTAVVLGALGVIGVLVDQPAQRGDTLAGVGGPGPAAAASAPTAPAAVPSDPVVPPPPAADATLSLRLLGGSSWVSVRSAGAVLLEGLLQDGFTQDFRGPAQLEVVVGDKRYAQVTCNEVQVPATGPGKVLRLRCAAGGPAVL